MTDVVLKTELGSGTFGTIFEVLYKGAPKAGKIYELSDDKSINFETLRELSICQELKNTHPNMAKMEEIIVYKKTFMMIMEKYTCDLHTLIRKASFTDEDKINISFKLLHVVDFLHNHNIIHRDIKTNNVLMKKVNGIYEPYLGDFGAAKYFNTHENEKLTEKFKVEFVPTIIIIENKNVTKLEGSQVATFSRQNCT